MLLQGIFGWDFIRDLPPGSGGVPRIGTMIGYLITDYSSVVRLQPYHDSILFYPTRRSELRWIRGSKGRGSAFPGIFNN